MTVDLRVRDWDVIYVHLPTGDWRWQSLKNMSYRDAVFEALRREGSQVAVAPGTPLRDLDPNQSLENCQLFDIKMRNHDA